MPTMYAPPGVVSVPSVTNGTLYRPDPILGSINAAANDVGSLLESGFTFNNQTPVPIISVTSFPGVDPTGVADSTAGIQAAINSLTTNGGQLFFPPGTYKHLTSLVLASNVLLYGYGATLSYTGAAQQITSATTGVLVAAGIIGITLNAGSASTKVLELYSAYRCQFRDVPIKCTSQTNICIDLLVNTTGTTNVEGNYNNAFNDFQHVFLDGSSTCGTWIRMLGNATAPTVVTLNTLHNCSTGGSSACYVRGIDFAAWCDDNYFSGMTRIVLASVANSTAVGVIWNSANPTTNVGVYSNNFAHLAVDTFGTPLGDARVGIRQNYTKLNKVEYFFQEPQAAGGAFVLDPVNTLSYYINQCIGGTSNTVLRHKLWNIGGLDNPVLTVGGAGDISTQDVFAYLGINRTGNGNAGVALIGDTVYTAGGLRITRTPTSAGQSQITHRGAGNLVMFTQDAGGQTVIQDSLGVKYASGNGGLAFFGNAVQPQPTGYGTPTGAVRLVNFPGATATLAQTSGALADLLFVLKANGLLGN